MKVQYADYAKWQREWMKGEVLEGELRYWREQLEEAPGRLELATDRPRPAVQSYKGEVQSFLLPMNLSNSIRALARREGATLFMTLLAAFQTLLYRYTGNEDILVGTAIA